MMGTKKPLFTIEPEHLANQTICQEFLNSSFFILPCNDGEAVRAVQILEAVGAQMHISKQNWGATLDKEWNKIPWPLIEGNSAIKRLVIFELPALAGPPGQLSCEQKLVQMGYEVDVIDHHFYDWVDRYQPKSALEQLCERIHWRLNKDDEAIAVNDRSYIPGLKAMGLSKQEIRKYRMFDLRSQGNSASYIERQIATARQQIPHLAETKRAGIWYLDRPEYKQTYIMQELCIDHYGGLIELFEIKGHKIGYSGYPGKVKRLFARDFSFYEKKCGPLMVYGGGDAEGSQFWAIKCTGNRKAISTELVEAVWQTIIDEDSTPLIK